MTLHFTCAEVRPLAEKGLRALDALNGHPLGQIVDVLIDVARESIL
jgi:hypothetical protein